MRGVYTWGGFPRPRTSRTSPPSSATRLQPWGGTTAGPGAVCALSPREVLALDLDEPHLLETSMGHMSEILNGPHRIFIVIQRPLSSMICMHWSLQ